MNFQKVLAVHQNTFQKVLESSQKKTPVAQSYVSKVAGFSKSNHGICPVKKVFLERYLQNPQEEACVKDSILIKLHS